MLSPRFKRYLIPLIVILAILPVVTADVIYYYQEQICVYTTSSPITISTGPNGVVKLPRGTGYYVNVTTSSSNSFTANVNITNSSCDYFYEIVSLKVSSTVNLYVSNTYYVYPSSFNPINNACIVIYSSSGSYVTTLPIIQNGNAVTTSKPVPLSAGTYYISLLIQPNTPLPPPSANNIAAITVYLGANVVSSSAVPLPPL